MPDPKPLDGDLEAFARSTRGWRTADQVLAWALRCAQLDAMRLREALTFAQAEMFAAAMWIGDDDPAVARSLLDARAQALDVLGYDEEGNPRADGR